MTDEINHLPSSPSGGTDGIIEANIAHIMLQRSLNYAVAVLTDRALPDIRDGLKPVARHLLYAAHRMGLRVSQKHRKAASLVGETMGKFHPHGDSSIYGALIFQIQQWAKLHPVFDGQGNWGSLDGDGAAAMRYTEVKLTRAGEAFFNGLDEDAVSFKKNYDQTLEEPTVLPVTYPALLVQGTIGIAVGMASSIPTHNLRETLAAAALLLENPDAETAEIAALLPGPDLPTGGVLYDTHKFHDIIETGQGAVRLRATYKVEHHGKREVLVLDSLPYLPKLNKGRVMTLLSEAVAEKDRFPDITDIVDESNNMDVRIVVKLKPGASAEAVFGQLLSIRGALDVSVGYNMNVLQNGRPVQTGIRSALTAFNQFREEVILRVGAFRRKKYLARVHIIDGFLTILHRDNFDEAIRLIRTAKGTQAAAEALKNRFGLDDEQVSSILAMRLSSLNALEVQELTDERTNLVEVKIAYLNRLLDERPFRIAEMLKEYAKTAEDLGSPRVCRIDNALGQVRKADYVTEEKVVIHLTKDGYIKRMPAAGVRSQSRRTQGKTAIFLNPGDVVSDVFEGSTHDILLAVTASGTAYAVRVWDIPEGDGNHKGRHLNNLMPQLSGKEIASVLFAPDFNDKKAVLMIATRQGRIKAARLSEYAGATRVSGVAAVRLEEGDRVVSVRLSESENDDILMVSDEGLCARFKRGDVSIQGRVSRGVSGMKVSKAGAVLTMDVSARSDGRLLTIAASGIGKCTPVESFRLTSRGAKGVTAMKCNTGKVGPLAFASVVYPEQDVLLCTTSKIKRLPLDAVSEASRSASGTILIDLTDGDSLVAVIPSEKEAQNEDSSASDNAVSE